MSKSLARVRAALEAADVPFDLREMTEGTRTAEQAAAAAGCALDQIVKSSRFRGTGGGQLRRFLPAGGNRIDPGRASRLAQEPLERADAAQVRADTGFAIGGVAPLGHLAPCALWMDPRLMDFARVWAAAGTPRHIFAIAPADLQRITGAPLARFTAQTSTDSPDPDVK